MRTVSPCLPRGTPQDGRVLSAHCTDLCTPLWPLELWGAGRYTPGGCAGSDAAAAGLSLWDLQQVWLTAQGASVYSLQTRVTPDTSQRGKRGLYSGKCLVLLPGHGKSSVRGV